MTQSYDQITQAQRTAEAETLDHLKNASLSEVLDHARSFHSDYKALLQQGFEQQGWISSIYFEDMMSQSYPQIDADLRRQVAREIEHLILEKMGEPTSSIQQSDIMAANRRRETALEIAATLLSEEQINDLERQARTVISPDKFPENFEDQKTAWLTEWVAKRLIKISESASGSVA